MTPNPERSEFAQLLAAHANRELLPAERQHLAALAAGDPEHLADLHAVEAVHAAFAHERALARAALRPVDPREEADPLYRDLGRAAARAETQLKAGLRALAPVPVMAPVRPRWVLRVVWFGAAAAALWLAWLLWLRPPQAPPLLDGQPNREVLSIRLVPEVNKDLRTISWQSLSGARRYDVVVEDAAGKVLLERPAAAAKSTRWDLSETEFTLLSQQREPLTLRVIARDGIGLPIGSSGDLPLSVR